MVGKIIDWLVEYSLTLFSIHRNARTIGERRQFERRYAGGRYM